MQPFYIVNAFGALFGFCLSFHIAHSKAKKQPLVCPMNGHCDAVVQSPYSRFLGIPLEYLGMLYYAISVVGYLILGLSEAMPDATLVFSVYIMSLVGFLFSLYLTFIQAFHLRTWCTWCLESAATSVVIFFLTAYSTTFNWVGFFDSHAIMVRFIAVLGIILGVGGTTIVDLLFYKFLQHLKISVEESEILAFISQVVWMGLALLVLADTILYGTHPELLGLAVHQAGLCILGITLVNALFLNLLVTPQLVHISFGGVHDHTSGELRFLRQFSFALLSVSLVSWYALLAVYFWSEVPQSLSSIFAMYGLSLLLALVFTQFVERRLASGNLIFAPATIYSTLPGPKRPARARSTTPRKRRTVLSAS